MNALRIGPAVHEVLKREVSPHALVDDMRQQSRAAWVTASDDAEQTATTVKVFPALHAPTNPQSMRVAIKVRGRILFINLSDVISVQARGSCVWLQQNATSYLLRESISAMAERLGTRGFIRIHRSVLVNSWFVEEIRPLSTGEYCLRLGGGREYTVTRTYKKNLQSLAEFWIGTGPSFPG